MANSHIQIDEHETFRPATEIISEHEQCEVSAHPFFVRLSSRPVDLRSVWVFVANTHAGISPHFVRWLAGTISRLDDVAIASLIAKQLNDELGDGRAEDIHSRLLQRFVDGLAPWRPPHFEDCVWAGEQLARRTKGLFESPDPYLAVGSLMVAEIFAKKMDRCLGDEIRRQSEISTESLTWLTLHEVLECEHADDSGKMGELIPKTGPALASVWRGATRQWDALWEFLDNVDRISLDIEVGSAASAYRQ